MNILFIIRSLECGGAERQLTLLANELGRRGHDVAIAAFRSGGARELDIDPEHVRLIDLRKGSRWDLLPFYWRLAAAVRRRQPDVIHGYLSAGNLAATAAWGWNRSAGLVWGIRDSNMDLRRYSLTTRMCAAITRALSFTPHTIVVNSAAGVGYSAANGFPAKKLVHVPNGIDTSEFYPDPDSGARIRGEWLIGASDKLIGLVGRIDPMKGHEIFLRAALMITRLHPGLRFVCIGSGPHERRRALMALAQELNLAERCLWISERSDMRAVYNAMDVFCSASVYGEGFPNVLGEAMACGRPCVVTDVGDAAFVAGNAARIVAPNNLMALASAVFEQLNGPPHRAEARQRIESLFSLARLADRTEAILATSSKRHVTKQERAPASRDFRDHYESKVRS